MVLGWVPEFIQVKDPKNSGSLKKYLDYNLDRHKLFHMHN